MINKALAKSRYWDWKAKESTEIATSTEKERDEVKKEAHIAQLATVAVGDARARAEDDLAKVRDVIGVNHAYIPIQFLCVFIAQLA